jgi:preprotein translocase subunit YajC
MTVPFATVALLQRASGPSQPSIYIVETVAIIAIFYFLMIRPQQTQRKKHEGALMQLKKGDDVVTAGGIIARVVHIKESTKEGASKSLEDPVTIQSGETRLIVERGRISRVGTTSVAPAGAKQADV